jgi:hypothetical protein
VPNFSRPFKLLLDETGLLHDPETQQERVPYSLLRIPKQGGQAFRRKVDTDSDGSRTVIPIDPGRP